jgi:hypothetical protein
MSDRPASQIHLVTDADNRATTGQVTTQTTGLT